MSRPSDEHDADGRDLAEVASPYLAAEAERRRLREEADDEYEFGEPSAD